jgi:glutaredoxin-like protein NrdH
MSVTVYTIPACVQCESTKRFLNRANIEYNVIDLSVDPEAYDMVKDLGYTEAPVVVAGDDHWSGFRPDKIETLV